MEGPEEVPSGKEHWETVYRTKPPETVGWYQPVPMASLGLIERLGLPQNAPIIDVGGGDSYLSDHLYQKGFTDLTVLDISGAALQRAQERYGREAEKIRWVESDILEFTADRAYTLWHDRAAFHFLTGTSQIGRYLEIARMAIPPGGFLILGTFSDKGPSTCSGLPVQRYSIPQLEVTVAPHFEKIRGV
ncbi:MAG: class I SAM-dependent methyltransferase, partial [Robiginitalea sp.]|nr:class I SAM-dependent methyltransferase [Robiginitalea sp.]